MKKKSQKRYEVREEKEIKEGKEQVSDKERRDSVGKNKAKLVMRGIWGKRRERAIEEEKMAKEKRKREREREREREKY